MNALFPPTCTTDHPRHFRHTPFPRTPFMTILIVTSHPPASIQIHAHSRVPTAQNYFVTSFARNERTPRSALPRDIALSSPDVFTARTTRKTKRKQQKSTGIPRPRSSFSFPLCSFVPLPDKLAVPGRPTTQWKTRPQPPSPTLKAHNKQQNLPSPSSGQPLVVLLPGRLLPSSLTDK